MRQLLYLGLNNKGTTDFNFRVVANVQHGYVNPSEENCIKFYEGPYKSLIMKFIAM